MRTLVVAGAPVVPEEYAEVFQSASRVVAVDSGADVCFALGRVPDLAVGDFDSVSAQALERLAEEGVETIRYSSDKDVSDLELALDILADRGWGPVILACALGGRFDHSAVVLGSVMRRPVLVEEVWQPSLRAWPLDAESRPAITLTGTGASVSILAVGGRAAVTCSGMRYPLTRAVLEELSSHGLSNTLEGDTGRVEIVSGQALVITESWSGSRLARATASA